MRSFLASLVMIPALMTAACATLPEASRDMTDVSVSATYRERIMLPPGHTLTVRIEDVSRADAPSLVIAEARQPLDGRAPPYAVTLSVPNDRIDSRMEYAARAEIRDASGALRFTTDTRHSVLTRGAPNSADIVMVGVR
ncbi:YbaY family lipoprotein [Brevundimonas naejangsanensis]|uniref:YbaY family lipoprotein n=1 Tax=Brevundimonas naejangsanensis TaxID=588932 RepID=UPI0004A3A075|nr:YbaY family lipoprotein [Brevundimonas naejangsanensis]